MYKRQYIALVEYTDGERRYIPAPVGLNVGDTVLSSAAADIKPGNALPLANIDVYKRQTSAFPPAASIFAFADSENAEAFTVSFLVISPLPRIFTP